MGFFGTFFSRNKAPAVPVAPEVAVSCKHTPLHAGAEEIDNPFAAGKPKNYWVEQTGRGPGQQLY